MYRYVLWNFSIEFYGTATIYSEVKATEYRNPKYKPNVLLLVELQQNFYPEKGIIHNFTCTRCQDVKCQQDN